METQYKREEIKEHFDDFIEDQPKDWIEENKDDLHHYAFNEDYFIIGYRNAEHWLGDVSTAFDVIKTIKDYEDMQFGEPYTDLTDSEKVVNMYAYIVGEEIVQEYLEKQRIN